MKFVTLSDMAHVIRDNFHKVPHDVDFVLGVPRSGIIAASIISEFLNVALVDVDSFVSGAKPTGGARLHYRKDSGRARKRVLVVDDTIFGGGTMRAVRKKLAPFNDRYEFIYMVVFHEGPCNDIDLALTDVRSYTDNFKNIVLYEWNILQHHAQLMSECIYDLDGVFCIDPPDERNAEEYLNYIRNAMPLFLPATPIGEIVTYRLVSNQEATKLWLLEHGIKYKTLTMFPASSWDERNNSGISTVQFKSDIYNSRIWAKLFVESDDEQARAIHEKTGKPVYCVGSNMMYPNL